MAISDGITIFDDFRNAAANPNTPLAKMIKPFQTAKKVMPDIPPEDQKAYSSQGNPPPAVAPSSPAATPVVPPLGGGLSSVVLAPSSPDTGFITGSEPGQAPTPIRSPGAEANSGIITADTAKRPMGNDMRRSGGIAGGIDMAGVNEIMGRENAARQSIIDSQRTDLQPGGGVSVLGVDANGMTQTDRENAEKTARWRQDDLLSMAARGNQAAVGAAINANAQAGAEASRSATALRGQDMHFASEMARNGITARGQDLSAKSDATKTGVLMRGQDLGAASDAAKIGIQKADSLRADAKWGIERGILQGQAADSEAQRGARQGLIDAIKLGDQKAIAQARNSAIAAGITLPKDEVPSSSYTPNQAGMPGGMAVTKNPDGSLVLVPVDAKGTPGKSAVIGGNQPANPQQEYQAAISRAAGNPELIARINERAKANGVIK